MAGKMLVERTTSHREGNSARPEGEAPEKGKNRAAQAHLLYNTADAVFIR